jgi:hypothetical protein
MARVSAVRAAAKARSDVVAGEVAVPVVVVLEPVQVEHDDGEVPAAAGGGELAGDVALELAPVGESGERVGHGQPVHLEEEARVLDGDGRLVGERAEELDVLLAERVPADAGQGAERDAAALERRGGERCIAEQLAAGRVDERVEAGIDDGPRLSGA